MTFSNTWSNTLNRLLIDTFSLTLAPHSWIGCNPLWLIPVFDWQNLPYRNHRILALKLFPRSRKIQTNRILTVFEIIFISIVSFSAPRLRWYKNNKFVKRKNRNIILLLPVILVILYTFRCIADYKVGLFQMHKSWIESIEVGFWAY